MSQNKSISDPRSNPIEVYLYGKFTTNAVEKQHMEICELWNS